MSGAHSGQLRLERVPEAEAKRRRTRRHGNHRWTGRALCSFLPAHWPRGHTQAQVPRGEGMRFPGGHPGQRAPASPPVAGPIRGSEARVCGDKLEADHASSTRVAVLLSGQWARHLALPGGPARPAWTSEDSFGNGTQHGGEGGGLRLASSPGFGPTSGLRRFPLLPEGPEHSAVVWTEDGQSGGTGGTSTPDETPEAKT